MILENYPKKELDPKYILDGVMLLKGYEKLLGVNDIASECCCRYAGDCLASNCAGCYDCAISKKDILEMNPILEEYVEKED